MNPVLETPKSIKPDQAANSDHLGDHAAERMVVTPVSGSGQGWDAYDAWRRLIKDARDRREGRAPSHS
jgi:hypothetical protein